MDRGAWRATVHGVAKESDPTQKCTIFFSKELWCYLPTLRASLLAQPVKNPPAMWETEVQFLGWEDPLEKRMATHSSVLAWRIPFKVCH